MASPSETATRANSFALELFSFSLCDWQLPAITLQVDTKQHVFNVATTGGGKTATILIAALMNAKDKGEITAIVTPLNLLTSQTHDIAVKLGIKSICLTAETSTKTVLKDIAQGHYSVIRLSPEQLTSPAFDVVFKSPKFYARLRHVVIDEAHVLLTWGKTFRPAYTALQHLLYKQPHIRFFFTSATLTPGEIEEITEMFRLPEGRVTILRRSNDRPLMRYMVKEMEHNMSMHQDLAFLLGDDPNYAQPPPTFCIFTNTKSEARNVIKSLKKLLPSHLKGKLRWITAATDPDYTKWLVKALGDGTVWGFGTTDLATMGLDVNNITTVVQWRMVARLSTLLQRFGRGGRKTGMVANAIFMVEKGVMKAAQATAVRRKAVNTNVPSADSPEKSIAKDPQDARPGSEDEVEEEYAALEIQPATSRKSRKDKNKETNKKIHVGKETMEKAVLDFITTDHCRRLTLNASGTWDVIARRFLEISSTGRIP